MKFDSLKKEIKAQVEFLDFCHPSLEAGKYEINFSQRIQGKGEKENVNDIISAQKKTVIVKGERFSLSNNLITSVFPHENAEGSYYNCLPHITLSNPTIPWQRDASTNRENRLPWLALLVFNDQEIPVPQEVSIMQLASLSKSDGNLFFDPNFTYSKDMGESDDNKAQVIDISLELFNKIAPSKEDLRYLCHVRNVSMENKEISKDKIFSEEKIENKQKFAVIVANRLPNKTGTTAVHLVSLEGLSDYLPDSQGHPSSHSKLKNKNFIRLVTLKNWQFKSTNNQIGVSQAFKKLNMEYKENSDFRFRDSVINQLTDSNLQNALKIGYVPLQHNMRRGDKTLSWYRGPLVPYKVQDNQVEEAEHSDSLLRYDPKIGMFDVSYSAAWQLGKLLAIQDKSLARTLYKYKKANEYRTINFLKQKLMQEKYLPGENNLGADGIMSTNQSVIKSLLIPQIEKFFR